MSEQNAMPTKITINNNGSICVEGGVRMVAL